MPTRLMIFFTLLWITLFIFATLLTQTLADQAPQLEGTLVYVRQQDETMEFIHLSAANRSVYTLVAGNCPRISPNALYLAESSQSRSDLIIRRLDDETIIAQIPWRENWETCFMSWETDTILRIRQTNEAHTFSYFDFATGSLQPLDYQPPPRAQYPDLPGRMPQSLNRFILPSPQSGIYLYEQCHDPQPVEEGERCLETDFVIYDANRQLPLHVLVNPNDTLVSGFDVYYQLMVPSAGTAWSADGRYLAFQHFDYDLYANFTLSVYDLASDAYLDTEYFTVDMDQDKPVEWSPVGNKLTLWVIGRPGAEPEPTDDENTRTFVTYDATTQTFQEAERVFDADQGFGLWSPDGQTYALVDGSGTLWLVDVNTGKTVQLDTAVTDIVGWKIEP
ncbi:MAG TPA: hypothetical protein VHO69_02260 [Phototrophicaceae bacterium]|nr:hypothetical protein [Phototrophicaceae bacterium]